MKRTAPWLETDVAIRRFLVGWGVLTVTVLLSNAFGFLDHPDRIFDVAPNSGALERVHLLGFFAQLVFGCWLGFALIFEVRAGRRLAALLWVAGVAAFFAPLPSAVQDGWMAPGLVAVAALVGLLSRAVDAALLPHAG